MKLAASLVASIAALAAVAAVFAHAEPATVKPGDGAVLLAAPLTVEMEMSQDMARQEGANDIDVFDASGIEVTTTAAAIDNGNRRKLTVALPSALSAGVYTVKWKTLSADDGDPAIGSVSFTIDPNGPASPGKEVLREELLGGETATAAAAPGAVTVPSDRGGTSWVLVVAVAVGMFVLGAGSSWVVVQKRP